MRKKLALYCFTLALAFAINSIPASAEVTSKWGSAFRLRHELWKNWKDMDSDQLDNRNFFRFKNSIWGQLNFDKTQSLYAKLTNEFKAYTYLAPSTTKTDKAFHFDIDEVFFDNLYADLNNFLDLPVDLRVGRQDFLGTYGEGFLIMDGTPQDGSRSFYFNAIKAAWKTNDKNSVDFIYTKNPRDDTYLPIINENKTPQNLNTTDEEAYILYWKNKDIKDIALENYYILKREDDDSGAGYQAQKGTINTFGSFAKYNLAPFTLRGQLAYQNGDYGDNDRDAIGGYVYVDRDFAKAKMAPKVSLGYIYLSGDDRDTTKNEGWDPLFSRWPWLSELYVLSMSAETGISGYWTNLTAWRMEFSIKPTEKTKLSLWYNYLRANETTAAGSILSGDNKDRGHLPQARLDYAINKNCNAYILAEYLFPGKYYANDSGGLFLRTELAIKF
ncbi:MAG: alginate export family protein [Candidatus Omnitrophica bacterium]|nr:alginate export family protein [Candidatus Omnitrophota bacterium]